MTLLLAMSSLKAAAAVCNQSILLQTATSKAMGLKTRGVVLGDFNRDGILDVAMCGPETGGGSFTTTVFVLLGNGSGGVGDGTFGTPVAYTAGTRPWSIVTADFDGDGKLDLATTNFAGNDVTILHGNGD